MTLDDDTQPEILASSVGAARRKRGRSWAILIVLAALCLLFYAITIVKMAHF